MKRLLLLLFSLALLSSAYPQSGTQGQRGVTIERRAATTTDYIRQGCRSLIFIFSSDFVGTVQGIAFTGAADSWIGIPVQTGDVLGDVTYTVTAGSVRIVYTR